MKSKWLVCNKAKWSWVWCLLRKASADELITEKMPSLLIIYEYFLTLRAACSMLSEPSQYDYTVDFSACHTVLQHGLSQHLTKRIDMFSGYFILHIFLVNGILLLFCTRARFSQKFILQVTIKSKDAFLKTLPFELRSCFLYSFHFNFDDWS